jgi:hypothetical protein
MNALLCNLEAEVVSSQMADHVSTLLDDFTLPLAQTGHPSAVQIKVMGYPLPLWGSCATILCISHSPADLFFFSWRWTVPRPLWNLVGIFICNVHVYMSPQIRRCHISTRQHIDAVHVGMLLATGPSSRAAGGSAKRDMSESRKGSKVNSFHFRSL